MANAESGFNVLIFSISGYRLSPKSLVTGYFYFCTMFGMDKLMALKKQAEEVKDRLNNITVEGEAAAGKVVVRANGNRKVTDIKIDPEWMRNAEHEEVEELMLTAVNRALEKAESVSESEMRSLIPGLGF